MSSTASPARAIINVDNDETCCFCWDKLVDNETHYRPPCSHLYHRECMEEARLNVCFRCTQPFIVAEAVKVLVRGHVVRCDPWVPENVEVVEVPDDDDDDMDEDDVTVVSQLI